MTFSLDEVPLIDHHCHVLVEGDLPRPQFEAMLSEGGSPPSGVSRFDTAVGLAVRRHCAPVLGLEPHAPADAYLQRRFELGADEVAGRLMRAAGLDTLLVDTGLTGANLGSVERLGEVAAAPTREIVRLETVAETLAQDGVAGADFAHAFPERLADTVAVTGAVGVKSIAAYRCGFDFEPTRPDTAVVAEAAEQWLRNPPADHAWRLSDPTLVRYLLWVAVDLGLPIQIHVGYGDSDIRLHRTNPALLTDWLHLADPAVPVMLLHCYPFQREAGYLAAVYPNVYLDLGLTLSYVGPAPAGGLLAEALELCPFDKMLFSTDAYGLPELYYLGTTAFRAGLGSVLEDRVRRGEWTDSDAHRIAALVGAGNARRAYRLAGKDRG